NDGLTNEARYKNWKTGETKRLHSTPIKVQSLHRWGHPRRVIIQRRAQDLPLNQHSRRERPASEDLQKIFKYGWARAGRSRNRTPPPAHRIWPLHCPAVLAAAAPAAARAVSERSWSAGKRCLRQTFRPQPLHWVVLEKMSVSLHLRAGHRGLFFFAGSQVRDRACASRTAFSSCPGIRSMATPQASQMTTVRPWSAALAQPWSRYVRCSVQNILPQPSQWKGRKSSWLQSGRSQCAPRSGKNSVPRRAISPPPSLSSAFACTHARVPLFRYAARALISLLLQAFGCVLSDADAIDPTEDL
ncbi:hypothetical protein EJB05_42895, partial [Eragrostis curvula]